MQIYTSNDIIYKVNRKLNIYIHIYIYMMKKLIQNLRRARAGGGATAPHSKT